MHYYKIVETINNTTYNWIVPAGGIYIEVSVEVFTETVDSVYVRARIVPEDARPPEGGYVFKNKDQENTGTT